MKFFKTLFTIIGVGLGVMLLLIGIILIVKPYGIDLVKVVPVLLDENKESTYDHPYLNTEQEAILESAGVDLEEIPTEVTKEQQDCATSILGEARIQEIIDGSMPSLVEILKVKECL